MLGEIASNFLYHFHSNESIVTISEQDTVKAKNTQIPFKIKITTEWYDTNSVNCFLSISNEIDEFKFLITDPYPEQWTLDDYSDIENCKNILIILVNISKKILKNKKNLPKKTHLFSILDWEKLRNSEKPYSSILKEMDTSVNGLNRFSIEFEHSNGENKIIFTHNDSKKIINL